MDGNLCRCTGYRPILEAYSALSSGGCCSGSDGGCPCRENGSEGADTGSDAVAQPSAANDQEPIFPAELLLKKNQVESLKLFETSVGTWARPVSLEQYYEAIKLLPTARILSGNTEIGVEAYMRKAERHDFIYIAHVAELQVLTFSDDLLSIGGSVTLRKFGQTIATYKETCSPAQASAFVAFEECLKLFAGSQIRSVATLAGNLMNASPISDLNPFWVALDAEIVLRTRSGDSKTLPAASFFTGYRSTAAEKGDIVECINVRLPADTWCFWYKQSRRIDDDISIVNACFAASVDANKTVTSFNAGFGGLAATTISMENLRQVVLGKQFEPELITKAQEVFKQMQLTSATPGGMPTYRMSLAVSFFFKFFWSLSSMLYGLDSVPPAHQSSLLPIRESEEYKGIQTFDELADVSCNPVGTSVKHQAAEQQTTGEAKYVDDHPPLANEVHAAMVTSRIAHGKILNIDTSRALELPGVVGIYTARDIPGINCFGPLVADEPFLADDVVMHVGQFIAIVVADTREQAELAAQRVDVTYDKLEPILDIAAAREAKAFHNEIHCKEGDASAAIDKSEFKLTGSVGMGGQEHFYFEPQSVIAIPSGEGEMEIISSTQQLSGAQAAVAAALKIPQNKVYAHIKRIGGGFGGKESRSNLIATLGAIAAHCSQRPVRLVLPRYQDMAWSGGRNPCLGEWEVGYDSHGKVHGLKMDIFLNSGFSADLSNAVNEKACLHVDSVYHFDNIEVHGYTCRTNLASNTAFRGFGAPQAMFLTETIINSIAAKLQLDPYVVRSINMHKNGDVTYYGQTITESQAANIWDSLALSSDYEKRRANVEAFNEANKYRKRGISIMSTKFGVCYEPTFQNQGSALVQLLLDGSVQLFHGGVEMGQGLHTKMVQVCAASLNLPVSAIHTSKTSTDTSVNEPPTAASLSSDRFGLAVMDACDKLNEALAPYREKMPDASFKDIVNAAWFDRVPLSATGFGKIENVFFDFATMKGTPYAYYSYGAACTEVEVDVLTGQSAVLRTDLVMDVGRPLNPRIDIGQIEGAFMQGVGLFMMEEKTFLADGRDITVGPGSYKIPSFKDIPLDFRVHLLRDAPNKHAVHSSKAVGEPPLFLGASAYFAIDHAVESFRKTQGLSLDRPFAASPFTCERILLACENELSIPAEESDKHWKISSV